MEVKDMTSRTIGHRHLTEDSTLDGIRPGCKTVPSLYVMFTLYRKKKNVRKYEMKEAFVYKKIKNVGILNEW